MENYNLLKGEIFKKFFLESELTLFFATTKINRFDISADRSLLQTNYNIRLQKVSNYVLKKIFENTKLKNNVQFCNTYNLIAFNDNGLSLEQIKSLTKIAFKHIILTGIYINNKVNNRDVYLSVDRFYELNNLVGNIDNSLLSKIKFNALYRTIFNVLQIYTNIPTVIANNKK